MAKSDSDHARQLLEMARADHTALQHMLNPQHFSEEVFGFHAQQAIEKALKAWITSLQRTYPKTHDLSALVTMLESAGADLSGFQDLEDYTVFAVQYRYESYDTSDVPLDRAFVLRATEALISHVYEVLSSVI